MFSCVERGWRRLAAIVSYTSFCLGGVICSLLVFPLMFIVVREQRTRSLLARKFIHLLFRLFLNFIQKLGVISFEVDGMEKLQRNGLLILGNHPSLLDVVLLISLISRADCVVKAKLLRNPIMRGALLTAGYICNDSGPLLVDECISSLRAGNNLIIFPEGTRTRPGLPVSLQRGAAHVAVRGGVAITPVLIHCNPPYLTKQQAWWSVPPQRPHFRIEIRDDWAMPMPLASTASEAVAARRLTETLSQYFAKETQGDCRYGCA